MADKVFTITHSPEGIRLTDGGGVTQQWSNAIHLAEAQDCQGNSGLRPAILNQAGS